ncbi:MAG: tetratricopeptide repeat protein [Polyangiaceae bacterium]
MANQGANTGNGQAIQGLNIQGGAAIVAPVTSFQNGIPPNALVVLPVQKMTDELKEKLEAGPLAVTREQMWELLGFNGPAVQVQDDQGRPLMIGLEDLLGGLDKHFNEKPEDLNRGRIYAQELMKHERFQRAEQVLSKVVAKGGSGEDWLALGICQLQQDRFDKAEGTLKGAQNLLKTNPYPSLHLAKLQKKKENLEAERQMIDKALEIDGDLVDAWAYLFTYLKDNTSEESAVSEMEKFAKEKKSARPLVALQAFYASKEEGRDKAIEFGKKALQVDGDDVLALLALSALYGQKGDLPSVVTLLQPHEAKMTRDVRLANNYFEALFQSRQIDKVTKLLNALAGSQNQQVKEFALQRSKAVAQFLQQQQQQIAKLAGAQPKPS